MIIVLFPSVHGPGFWLQAGTPLSLFTVKMAKIWQNRGALRGAQWRVPTNCILYVSTLMLALLSYCWFISRSGPTFEKIAFILERSKSRTELRNLQILKKNQVSVCHRSSLVSRKAWTLSWKLQELNKKILGKLVVAVNLEVIRFEFWMKGA